MIRITVQYDKYNRTFKLLDLEFGSVLEDGAPFELLVPFNVKDGREEEGERVLLNSTPSACA